MVLRREPQRLALHFLSPLRGLLVFLAVFLGLTPQAKYLPPLRGSGLTPQAKYLPPLRGSGLTPQELVLPWSAGGAKDP